MCDEVVDPVESTETEEVVKQALENKNPVAKKVIERIKQAKADPPEPKHEPQPQQPAQKEQDCFEWLAKQFKFN